MIRHLHVAAVVSASLMFAAVPASAQEEVSVTVEISDLDMHSAEGAAELRRRIGAAARRACGPPENGGIAALQHVLTCREQATRSVRVR